MKSSSSKTVRRSAAAFRRREQTLGNRLRSFRKNQNLTQVQFAEMLGVHFQSILRYERGILIPGADFLMKLAELFRLNPNWILFGHEPQLFPRRDEPREAEYDVFPYPPSRTREPFFDYRAAPPPNALVETVEVPHVRTLQALAALPPKPRQIEKNLLLPKAWLMHPEESCVVAVQTNALRSSLRRGDILVLDWSDRGASAADGSIVAARLGRRIVLKRFALTPLQYLFEDDDSKKPLLVAKEEGSPILARGLFAMRQG